MEKIHSFFIPDSENCTNKEKLVKILAEKIFLNFECVYCSYIKQKSFKNFRNLQKHMNDVGHCMMHIDNLGEFINLYDYSKDNQRILEKYILNQTDENRIFTSKDFAEFEIVEIAHENTLNGSDSDDEWISLNEEEVEFIESDENVSDQEKKALEGLLDPNKKYDLRKFALIKAKKLNTGELLLPNQKKLGSKKYTLYYQQYYRERLDINEMRKFLLKEDKELDSRALMVSTYQDVKKRYVLAKKMTLKQETRLRNIEHRKIDKVKFRYLKKTQRQKMNKDMRHNLVLTKHFREQNLQSN